MNGATAWNPAAASAGSSRSYVWALSGKPCRQSASGPLPASRYVKLTPLACTRPRVSSIGLPEVLDPRRDLLHQQAQALVVPAGVVGVRRDRQQRAEAAALGVQALDLVHDLRWIADNPHVVHQVLGGHRLVRQRGIELGR